MSCVGELSWEHALVTACLAGDGTAREQFAVLYRDMLRRFIRGCLGSIEDADNVGEDLTQSVWVRLVERAYEPLRDFDASERTLTAFLQDLGLKEVRRYLWRRRRRRKKGEVSLEELAPEKVDPCLHEDRHLEMALREQEFLATLAPQYLDFIDNYLLRPPAEGEPCPYTENQIWKLRRGLIQHWQAFLRRDRDA